MATEKEFLEKLKSALASERITKDEARQAIAKFKELQSTEAQPITESQTEQRGFIDKLADTSSAISDYINRSVMGTGEAAMSIGSAALAEPVAGLRGVAAMVPGGTTPVEAIEQTRESMTYQPRSQAGQQAMQEFGTVMQPVGEAFQAAQEFTGEAGYRAGEAIAPGTQAGPIMGAITSTIPAAIAEVLGFKGTRAAKVARLEEAVKTNGASSVMTPEVLTALTRQGVTPKEIARITKIPQEQVDRLIRFQEQRVPPTLGDITQDTGQRMSENQLLNLAEGDAGSNMRTVRTQQSQALQANFDDLIDSYGTGIPEETGIAIKDAVNSRRQIVKADARAAYDSLANAQGGADNIPLLVPSFEDMPNMPTPRELRSIKRVDQSNYNALQESLAEFGLSNDPRAIAKLADDGVVPEQLNITNFEEFRQSLNVIRRSDESGNLNRVLEPIISEVDRQIDIATESLMTSGNPDIASLAKDARNSWRSYLTEFDPKSLAEDLTKNKPRSTIPFLEVSQVYDKVVARGTPVEQVNRLLETLKSEGANGNRAAAQLKANVVADLMDSMFTGTSSKINGVPMVSGAALNKRFFDPKFNQKIQAIFKDDPDTYRQLERLAKTAEEIAPANIEIVKGAGGTVLDIINRAGIAGMLNVPLVRPIIEQIDQIAASAKNRTAFNKAIKARPELEMATNDLIRSFPMLSAALGIGYLAENEE